MNIVRIPLGELQANCYILINENNNEAVVVDPGGDSDILINYLENKNIRPVAILLTHGHYDHVGAVVDIADKYGIDFYIDETEEELILKKTYVFGDLPKTDCYLKDEGILNLAGLNIKCIRTPGHSPGGMCFLIGDILITGDTLFQQSLGRTDFTGGDFGTLVSSITDKLMLLDDNVRVLPGHGDTTTIGFERNNNPFLD